MSPRNDMLAKLHALKRMGGLSDDAYRDKLALHTGARSARELSDAELARVIPLFHVKQNANNPHTSKVKALWIAAFNLGAIENGRDAALDAFVKHQTGKERLAFVTAAEAVPVVEALKAILARQGFTVPAGTRDGLEARRALLLAQWKKLAKLGVVHIADDAALDAYVSHRFIPCKGSIVHLNREQADAAARALGRWIRATVAESAAPKP